MKTRALRLLTLLLLATNLLSCGGGGGGLFAGGGIGGTGIGTVTGFASVIINDTREFTFDADTRFFRDDVELSEIDFMQDGIGMVACVDVGDDVSPDFTSGTAVTVRAKNAIIGPVTSTNPLQVLQQTVVITGNTVLADVPGNDVNNLVIGTTVEVSGYADGSNVIQATRLQSRAGGVSEWKLTGPAGNVIANTSFQLGTQQVLLNGIIPDDCGTGLSDGDLVEVNATPVDYTDYVSGGNILTMVTAVECEAPGLGIPVNASDDLLDAEVEGIVTVVTAANSFVVNGQQVWTIPSTRFMGGTAIDIVPGARLEAEGDFDTLTGILVADEIRFSENRIRITAPVAPTDIDTVNDTISIMGINVQGTPLTEDNDDILVNGLAADAQLSIRAFIDSNAQVFATEISDEGAPDLHNVRLRGPVGAITSPTFSILGVTVDTATATTIIDESVEPEEIINATQFFQRISAGTAVEVEAGSYNNSGLNTITDGILEIEE